MSATRLPAITVEQLVGEAYEIGVRGHRVRVDQPVEAGGQDSGPTPTELLVGALAGCVAYYAGRYLARHGITREGLAVTADFDLATDRPARITAIRIRLTLPDAFPQARLQPLLAVVTHCTVHNTLVHAPDISVAVDQQQPDSVQPDRTSAAS